MSIYRVVLTTLFCFSTMNAALESVFELSGDRSELAAIAHNAIVTPHRAPLSLQGTLVKYGTGSVVFEPVAAGNGVAFLPGGQQNVNAAFYSFTGTGVQTVFGANEGEIRFTWKSRYSFETRLGLGTAGISRALDVFDSTNRRFMISAEPAYGRLIIRYVLDGSPYRWFYVPAGQEETYFGKGVHMNVRLTWGAGVTRLYINGVLTRSDAYTRSAGNWGATASFAIGAQDRHVYRGGHFAGGDLLHQFQVLAPGSPAPSSSSTPTVSIASPSADTTIAGAATLTALASVNDGIAGVTWKLNGTALFPEDTASPYTATWDSRSVPNGTHTLTATARSSSGGTASASISIQVQNAVLNTVSDLIVPSTPANLAIGAVTSTSATLSWSASVDNRGVAGYRIYRNGAFRTTTTGTSFLDLGLAASTKYQYEVVAFDAAGNTSPLSHSIPLTTPSATATIRRVGPGKTYATPCAAIAAANPGDVIEIAAGIYSGDVCAITDANLTIRGINGRAVIRAAGRNYGGKAIWVTTGANILIENVDLSGAAVPDRNGAAIRVEGPNLTLRNSYFHHNENGILTIASLAGELLIENCEFAYNGRGNGQTHNIYVGKLDKFTLRYSYSHHVSVGHLVKTRAKENHIYYNRLTDETGTASYELDVPIAGKTFVIGNLFQQSARTSNRIMISYGFESGLNPARDLYVVNNTFVSDASATTFVRVNGTVPALLQNNIFSPIAENTITNQAVAIRIANCTGNPGFVNAADYDYRLTSASACEDSGVLPGLAGISLEPLSEYLDRASGRQRATFGILDAGALERVP